MSPTQKLAVWLYEQPRLRRSVKVCCALWFGALWAVTVAPTAAADAPLPNVAFGDMAWTGLQDTYGVPISYYRVSTVGPMDATTTSAGQQLRGLNLFNPLSWVSTLIRGISQGINNILGSGLLGVECALLIFVAGVGIWFLQFAISATWLQWLATVAQPVVSVLQAMVNHYLVMPFGFLACTLCGGYLYLAKGKSHGLGIIFGGMGIIALYYMFFDDPVGEMLGPNGVMSVGQYLGFQVTEGAINNGALAPGNGGAQLGALISLLCTALVRDQIQMANFGTVVDNVPGCASLWSAAIMGGQQNGPAHAMGSCDPAALTYAQGLGLSSAGLFAVTLFLEWWIMVALLWIGWRAIYNGFKAFWRVLMLVLTVPLSVAPGAPRRFGKRQAVYAIHDGLELFASIAGLSVIAIIDGSVLAGGPPSSGDAISSPLGKEIFVLLITVTGAVGHHYLLKDLRNSPGFWGHVHQVEHWLVKRHQRQMALDFFSVNLFGTSITGKIWRRHIKDPDQDPALGDLEYHRQPRKEEPPGRTPPQPAPTSNHYTINHYDNGGSQDGQRQANSMPPPFESNDGGKKEIDVA
jgi:hypothetical protein